MGDYGVDKEEDYEDNGIFGHRIPWPLPESCAEDHDEIVLARQPVFAG